VKHAAGLRRSDRALLEQVGEQTISLLAKTAGELRIEAFDETLKRDAAETPELEELRERLANAPEAPDEKKMDEQLDRISDTLEHDEDDREMPERPIDEFGEMLTLLCDVLRNSELVRDVPLKTQLLKEAVRIWSLLAVGLMVFTEDKGLFSQVIDALSEAGVDRGSGDADKELRRFFRMLTLILVGFGASAALGTVHLGVAIDEALRDDEVMASPTRAWVLTVLYCHLGLPGWSSRLAALYEAFPNHVFLREVIADYALAVYRATRSQADAARLETFLADVFTPRGRGGPEGVQARAAERSQILEDLRSGRLRYQKQGPQASLSTETLDAVFEHESPS
jgi:hypothetical protein